MNAIDQAIAHLQKLFDNPKICKECKTSLETLADAAVGYQLGISQYGYTRLVQWIEMGCTRPADMAFPDPGVERQIARLVELALNVVPEKKKEESK